MSSVQKKPTPIVNVRRKVSTTIAQLSMWPDSQSEWTGTRMCEQWPLHCARGTLYFMEQHCVVVCLTHSVTGQRKEIVFEVCRNVICKDLNVLFQNLCPNACGKFIWSLMRVIKSSGRRQGYGWRVGGILDKRSRRWGPM